MKKFITSLLISLACSLSLAQSIDLKDMTPGQRAAIMAIAEHSEKPVTQPSTPAASSSGRAEASAWAELIGSAMFDGARKANMVVEEFSNTTVGRITVFIVAYKIIGKELIRLLVAGLIFTIGVSLGIAVCFRSMPKWEKPLVKTYEITPLLGGIFVRKTAKEFFPAQQIRGVDTDYLVLGLVISAVTAIMSVMVAFA